MIDLTFTTFALCGAIVLLAAILRGLTGFGFSLAAVPLLSLVVDPQSAVVVAVVLQLLIGFRDVVTLRNAIDRRSVLKLSLGAIAGVPLGIALLQVLDPAVMRIVIAATVFAALPIMLRRPPSPSTAEPRFALSSGVAAGFFGGLAAIPSPPAIFYFLNGGIPAATMRVSLMVFFFATALISTPGLYLAGLLRWQEVALGLGTLPIMLLGTWLGGLIFARSGETHYRRIALAVLLAMAVAAAARGIVDLV